MSIQNPITIRFTYSAEDYAEGARAAASYFRPPSNRVSRIGAYALTATGLIGGPWIFLSNPRDRSAWLVASAVFGLGLWYLYAVAVQIWRDRFGRRREFTKIEILQGPREMQFDEANHRVRTPQFTYDAAWDCYKAFAETPNLLLLSQPPGYVIIPKRAFTDDQLASFRGLVGSKTAAAQPQPSGRGFLVASAVGISILLLLYAALVLFASKP